MKIFLVGLFLLISQYADAGTISLQVNETSFSAVTRSYSIADTDIDRIVAAYQSPANVSINGTATRTQVLMYWFMKAITQAKSDVSDFENAARLQALPVITPINPQ